MYQKILLNIYIYSYAPVNQFTGTIAHSCVKNLLLKNKFMVFTATQFGRASVSNYTVQEKTSGGVQFIPFMLLVSDGSFMFSFKCSSVFEVRYR